MKIIFATGNKNKLDEIRAIMDGYGFDIVTSKDEGIAADPEENGESFEANALIKAKAVYDLSDGKAVVMADDSGLCIDALGGEPGIYSARFMGHDTGYDIKNAELLRRMEDVPEERRSARFVCAVAAVLPRSARANSMFLVFIVCVLLSLFFGYVGVVVNIFRNQLEVVEHHLRVVALYSIVEHL